MQPPSRPPSAGPTPCAWPPPNHALHSSHAPPLHPAGVCKKDAAGKPLSVLVMITDSCPECESDHLDVQSLAFGKVRTLWG